MTPNSIIPILRAGGILKLSRSTSRFWVVHNSREIPADQADAHKLANNGSLRPNGIDSHGNCVFALNTARNH